MIAVLVALSGSPVHFRITHRIALPDHLYDCHKALRDCSLVGSTGYYGHSDGGEDPLIVLKGKRIKFRNADDLGGLEVTGFAYNGIYPILKVRNTPIATDHARIVGGKLVLANRPKPLPIQEPPKNLPQRFDEDKIDKRIRMLMPTPKGIDGYQILDVNWHPWKNGYKLCQVTTAMSSLDLGARLLMKDPKGGLRRFEDYVLGLKGYEVLSWQWIDKDWLVVSAVKPSSYEGFCRGNGNIVFWIEAK